MISFGLSKNDTVYSNHINDLIMQPNGQLQVLTGAYSIAQSINCALSLWLGEYELNSTEGVPYKLIFQGSANPQLIDYQLTNAILSPNKYMSKEQFELFGIKKINSLTYSLDRQTRKFNLDAVVLLNNGQDIIVSI